jgi:hypothetical protein
MINEREKFLAALQTFDEGDLGDIMSAVRTNTSLVDTSSKSADDLWDKYVAPILGGGSKDAKKDEKAPTSWALYGVLAVGVVGAGVIVYALWPKKAKA